MQLHCQQVLVNNGNAQQLSLALYFVTFSARDIQSNLTNCQKDCLEVCERTTYSHNVAMTKWPTFQQANTIMTKFGLSVQAGQSLTGSEAIKQTVIPVTVYFTTLTDKVCSSTYLVRVSLC
jgi:hypothetical protein